MPKNIVKEGARWNFGDGSLQTYRGYQYAAYWDDARRVSVARRRLPLGRWEVVSLPGYQRTSNINRGAGGRKSQGFGDGHEKVAMGISSDGVIHLAFDHHVSSLRYRFSKKEAANLPEKFQWTPDLFSKVQNHLGGPKLATITYPSFTNHGDELLLYLRMNLGSGSADSHFYRYRGGRWFVNNEAKSKLISKQWSGGDRTVNAYPHSLVVRGDQHFMTWCWRDTPDPTTCHDLCFAYSDDGGQRWRNNEGTIIGVCGRKFITANSPGVRVVKIPPGSRYQNGGSMTVDRTGRVHVLMRGPKGKPVYFSRDPETKNWLARKASVLGKLVASPDGNLYNVVDSGIYRCSEDFRSKQWNGVESGATIDRLIASSGRNQTIRFEPVAKIDASRFKDCKFGLDRDRVFHDGVISLIGQEGKTISVIDFYLGPE